MNVKDNIRNSQVWVNMFLLLSLFFLFVTVFIINHQTLEDNAPASSDAIFGGRLEEGYQFSGYVISDLGETLKICSAVFISPTQAVTAAHCLDNNGEKFVGLGAYTSIRTQYFEIERTIIEPDWLKYNKIENDLGLIILKQPVILNEYAVIAPASKGCKYVVVGYGKQDNSEEFIPVRKSTDVCIENTEYLGTSISFKGQDGGLCFGDSGSGIFEAGTNKLVTIASSIDSCYVNNFAAGAQIAGKINLQTSEISTIANNSTPCGYIDVQNNKIIDNEDLQEFMNKYLQFCSDSIFIDAQIQCGSKDTNIDEVIDLEDFSRFAKLYKEGKCI